MDKKNQLGAKVLAVLDELISDDEGVLENSYGIDPRNPCDCRLDKAIAAYANHLYPSPRIIDAESGED
mgnify:CR=1 FL=1